MRISNSKWNKKQMLIAATVAMILLIALSAGTVYAYLKLTGNHVLNQFDPEQDVNPTIEETFDGNVKSDVQVNVGETGYSVYVRAMVVATWVKADGTVHATAPVAGTDYTLDWNSTDWFLASDGFYYHKAPIASEEKTAELIRTCAPVAGKAPDGGYTLNVKIVAQTIQALGATDLDGTPAVEDAWKVVKVDPATGNLQPSS